MCTTRILARSSSGFISQCMECERIHLAFGTAVLHVEWTEFDAISKLISQDVQLIEHRTDSGRKCVQIGLPENAGFSFVLTRTELMALHELVQQALLLLTTYQLLANE